jgi:hypothetical protein
MPSCESGAPIDCDAIKLIAIFAGSSHRDILPKLRTARLSATLAA